MKDALIAFAVAGTEERSVPRVTDWSALLDATGTHGLIPLANRALREGDCPTSVRESFQNHALGLALRSAQLLGELGQILTTLAEKGVETIVLKGPALAASIYPDPSLRPYRDLDIVCREEDWAVTHQTLLSLGYHSFVRELPVPTPRVWERKAYAHNVYIREDGNVQVEIHFDPWWHDLRPRSGSLIWQHAIPMVLGGAPTRTLAPEDQLLQLCLHLHRHAYSRAIWFSDLIQLIRTTPTLNWEYLVATARHEGFGLSVYYSLAYTEHIFGVAAPASVLVALRPGPLARWLHQRLWPLDRLFDRARDEEIPFGFPEVPNAVELLLNLLLTGRHREKLIYLGHLLMPPSEWLAYYYGTTDPVVLRRRRVVHAPKLFLTALSELTVGVRRGFTVRAAQTLPPF